VRPSGIIEGLRLLVVVGLLCCGACSSGQSVPTPVAPSPPPPRIAAPTVECPAGITVAAPTSAGVTVNYQSPASEHGEAPVTVTCTPGTGTTFPVGTTAVECVATDSLNRSGSCTFSVRVSAPPRLLRTRIMAFGDSLTEGFTVMSNDPYDLAAPPATAYPTVLSQLLSARYTDQTIRVFNRGLGGEQASRALSRLIATLAADAADVVVLQEGYNDYLRADSGAAGIAGIDRGIRELAGEARRRGARVFVCTLAPGKPGRGQIPASALLDINDRLRAIARNEGAVLVDLYAALLPDVNANVSIDGLHLTPLGYRRVAETVFAAVRADLEVR
jgi:lysophospholipase L1-like esterase